MCQCACDAYGSEDLYHIISYHIIYVCIRASRIKISHDSQKVTIPGKKEAYRLFNAKGGCHVCMLICRHVYGMG